MFTINVHNHVDTAQILNELNIIKLQNQTIMARIDELNQQVTDLQSQVTALQTSVDAEQEAINQLLQQNAAVVTDLNNQIATLQAQIAEGATPDQLNALASNLTAISESIATTKADIEGTVTDAAPTE